MNRWPAKPLLEVATLTRGTEPGSSSYTKPPSGIRFLRVGDITGKTDNPVYTNSDNLVIVSETDVLLALDGTPGHVSTGHAGAICSGIRKVEVSDGYKITSGWLRYSLMSPMVQVTIKQHTSGITILHAASAVTHIQIQIPPLEEQVRIVNLLDEVVELRKLRAQANHRTAVLIFALFHEMFGDPIRNTKSLPLVPLGEISSVERGKFSPRPRNDPSYYGGEHPFIQTGDIAQSDGILTRWKQTLNEKGTSASRQFPAGTVVIAIVGATIGETAILGIPVFCPDSVVGIQPNSDIATPEYIECVLRHWRPLFLAQAPETARANINLAIIKPLKVPLPELELQKKFTDRVAEIRIMETDQATSHQRLDELFKSLLHRAFQGEL